MTVRANTATGDWRFGRGQRDYISDAREIRQSLTTRLRMFQNDWFLDVQAGIDYIDLFGRKGTKPILRDEIARVVLGTIGVLSIEKLEIIEGVNRSATINLDVRTVLDPISLELDITP